MSSIETDPLPSPAQHAERELIFAPDARAAHAELEAQADRWGASAQPGASAGLTVVVGNPAARAQALGTLLGSGRARVGIEVQTLSGVALATLERAGQRPALSRALFEIEALRRAGRAEALNAATERLEEGPALVLPTLDRLLETGLELSDVRRLAESPDELDELDGSPLDRGERERFLELLAVAGTCAESAGGNIGLFRGALRALEADPELGPRRILLFGFHAATGIEGRWIRALFERPGSIALALGPLPSPEELARHPLTHLRSASIRERPASSPAQRQGAIALDPVAEVRATARRIAGELDEGIEPERIAVALLGPDRYSAELRVEFKRFGVPFGSAGLTGPIGPAGRELAAMARLLEHGAETPLRQVLPAFVFESPSGLDRLTLGLEVLGVSRLSEAARLDLGAWLGTRSELRLPLSYGRGGNGPSDGGPGGLGPSQDSPWSDAPEPEEHTAREGTAEPPSLERAELERFVARSRRVAESLESLGAQRRVLEAAAATRKLFDELFGTDPRPSAKLARRAVEELASELSTEFELESSGEWSRALSARLRRSERPVFGSGAAGVRVGQPEHLATGCFASLHVLGLDRSHAPAPEPRDPWLANSTLDRLADLLGDPPGDLNRSSGQRRIFELLLESADRVCLSRPLTDAEGKPKAASAWWPEGLDSPGDPTVPDAPRRQFAEHLALGRDASFVDGLLTCTGTSREAGEARFETLEELDAPPARAASRGPGPFLGAIGPGLAQRTGSEDLYVTTLEGLARCGWQTFLERILRLTPVPDREAALPSLEARFTGTVAHAALESLTKKALQETGGLLPRPTPAERLRVARMAAVRVARDAGLALPGYAEIYAQRALPLVDRALALLEQDGARIDEVEGHGTAEFQTAEGRSLELHFRADLVERSVNGARRFTDYKTGRPPGYDVLIKSVPARLLKKVAEGLALQAAVYARSEPDVEGRYLHIGELEPKAGDAGRSLALDLSNDELRGAFDQAIHVLLAAYSAGSFPPRLLNNKGTEEGPACRNCDVQEACLRGDSGIRGRFELWHAEQPEEPSSEELTADFLRWLQLGRTAK